MVLTPNDLLSWNSSTSSQLLYTHTGKFAPGYWDQFQFCGKMCTIGLSLQSL